jgi:DNA-binding protein YbaB
MPRHGESGSEEHVVSEPGSTPDGGAVNFTALRAQADQMVEQLHDRIEGIKAAQAQALTASGEATSRDGGVRVVVDATGVVTHVEFARTVFERNTPEKLAQTIVATVQTAAATARTQMAEAWGPIKEQGAAEMVGIEEDAHRLGLSMEVPQVPRTASDPTGQPDQWAGEPAAAPVSDKWAPTDQAPAVEPPPPPPAPMPAPPRRPAGPASTSEADDLSDERPW